MYRVCVCVSRCTYHKMIIIYQLLVIISYATTIFIIIFFFRFFSNSFHACLKKIESLKKNQQFEKLKKVFFWRNYWISWNSNKFNSTVQYTHNKHNLKRWIFQIHSWNKKSIQKKYFWYIVFWWFLLWKSKSRYITYKIHIASMHAIDR